MSRVRRNLFALYDNEKTPSGAAKWGKQSLLLYNFFLRMIYNKKFRKNDDDVIGKTSILLLSRKVSTYRMWRNALMALSSGTGSQHTSWQSSRSRIIFNHGLSHLPAVRSFCRVGNTTTEATPGYFMSPKLFFVRFDENPKGHTNVPNSTDNFLSQLYFEVIWLQLFWWSTASQSLSCDKFSVGLENRRPFTQRKAR